MFCNTTVVSYLIGYNDLKILVLDLFALLYDINISMSLFWIWNGSIFGKKAS